MPKNFPACVSCGAAVDAYLQHIHWLADKLPELTMIYFKVVSPFPDAWSSRVRVKVLSKRVHRTLIGDHF